MDFAFSDSQRARRERAVALAARLTPGLPAPDVVHVAAVDGLIDTDDLLELVIAIDTIAAVSAAPALALALHTTCRLSTEEDERLARGARAGSLTLATDHVPALQEGRLRGRASWVAPLSANGRALVAARDHADLVACAVDLDAVGLTVTPVPVSGLAGLVIGHLDFEDVETTLVGPTRPAMVRARVLIAAVGLGIARRAVREALAMARGTSRGAGGEQTVQGLIADAAVDLDAAMLLTWKAAASPPSLAAASMAKLAATLAAQRAVERAAQVVGADAFRDGHALGTLTQDVRALELFAGRTEALRDAVALEHLQ